LKIYILFQFPALTGSGKYDFLFSKSDYIFQVFLIIFVLVWCSALDNTPLLCSHGKVHASKVNCMKRISELAWIKLESKVCNVLCVAHVLVSFLFRGGNFIDFKFASAAIINYLSEKIIVSRFQ